ncbi:sigma-54-dependent transcriptional regulator [Thermosediminibacter oceani]|uniref:PTS system transcriptional activator n=1 Tax=Thermosediminibacter oceani (strain ATCC BAA-1034 / DSM 16646 / JW/IW-1228P) TaxID=555079 RepID=D9S0R0_THEOJ|nr:PTS system transcriptional activator [Thermosediminibacter oceani DSM 16646]
MPHLSKFYEVRLLSDVDIKLNRKDKVYKKLKELTESLTLNDLNVDRKFGFEAGFIGKKIGINRNNTSKELNRLVREGKAVKIKGKPVLYLDKNCLETRWKLKITDHAIKDYETFKKLFLNSLEPTQNFEMISNSAPYRSILDRLIGADESLKAQIEQAKAAILYPPHGLHTLIVGPTGVGKTTFAEAMYRYAVEMGKIPATAPFVVFNCADYAENPQLLLSQLFGYVRGAFTGADREKKGLVEQADGGILFLDEVHRLPPEGQEMMFLLMDKGIYRRLGESENTRQARVLIIAATTEDPKSALLHTFLRRIPVVIMLPGLEERSLRERMAFVCRFFREESARIKVPLKVSKEVLKAFLLYDCPGNIGQLKSDIQLICARAFLDYMTFKKDEVEVKLSHLSRRVREGFFKIGEKRGEIAQKFNLGVGEDVVFDGKDENMWDNLEGTVFIDEYKTADDFYEVIESSWNEFSRKGLSERKIREMVDRQIEEYFDGIFSRIKLKGPVVDRDALAKIVSPRILKTVEDTLTDMREALGGAFSQKFIYSVALHVSILLERLRVGTVISHPDKKSIAREHPLEYELARKVKAKLEERLFIEIPEDEIAFLAMLIYAAKVKKEQGNIGVLVISHGRAAASTMAQVANELLGVNHARALDMPLEEKVETVLEKAVEEVKRIDRGKGVLILVDMGSLAAFSEIITERTGIPTRTVEMVSTPMVIEATRKALLPDMTLDMLAEDVRCMSPYIGKGQHEIRSATYGEYKGGYFRGILIDILGKTLTFLNPQKACDNLYEVLKKVLHKFDRKIDDDIYVKFLFHCSCMIERIIRGEPLPYKNLKAIKKSRSGIFDVLKTQFELIEETFGIQIPDTEFAYIVEMLDTHFDTL